MADQDQAARIAAMRARRGQAPIQIDTTASTTPAVEVPTSAQPIVAAVSSPLPAGSFGSWAPPAAETAFVPSVPVLPVAQPAPIAQAAVVADPPARVVAAAERPAATARTNAANAQVQARAKKSHVAAGARILVTGLTASSVFGLTTVLAAANRPAAGTPVAAGATDPFGGASATGATAPGDTSAAGTTPAGSAAPSDTSTAGSAAPTDTATGVTTATTTPKAGSTSTVKAGTGGATVTTVKTGTTATTVKPATPTTVKAGGSGTPTPTTAAPAPTTTAAPAPTTTAAPTTTVARVSPPATPTITYSKLSGNYHTATVMWNAVPGATSYQVQICKFVGGVLGSCYGPGAVAGSATQASAALTSQTSYKAFVQAINSAGSSGTASAMVLK